MTELSDDEIEQHALDAVNFYQSVVTILNFRGDLSDSEKKEIVKEAMDEEF